MNKKELLFCLSCKDNYENFIKVNTKEELIKEMTKYFKEEGYFEDIEDIDDYMEEITSFDGPGEYCVDISGEISINKIDFIIEEYFDYDIYNIIPYPFNEANSLDDFMNWKETAKRIKEDEDCKYMYCITHTTHVVVPNEYTIKYIVKSNKTINNVIEYLNEEKDVFIGEFNSLGANYYVEEIENLDVDDISQYHIYDPMIIDIEE